MKTIYPYVLPMMVALSGCGALKNNVAFEQPLEGARARVRVVIPTELNQYRGVRAFPNKDCVPDLRHERPPGNGNVVASNYGFEANLNGQKIGMPETPLSAKKDTKQAEIFVTAGQPVVFRYMLPGVGGTVVRNGVSAPATGCPMSVSFIPEAGADYELEFHELDLSVSLQGSCAANLYRIGASAPGKEAAPIQVKQVDNCKRNR
jgi:hypothetical protein